jgi:hypothetical protein
VIGDEGYRRVVRRPEAGEGAVTRLNSERGS